jgi:hypothetical protein
VALVASLRNLASSALSSVVRRPGAVARTQGAGLDLLFEHDRDEHAVAFHRLVAWHLASLIAALCDQRSSHRTVVSAIPDAGSSSYCTVSTLAMSRGRKHAKRACGRRLDGVVRRHPKCCCQNAPEPTERLATSPQEEPRTILQSPRHVAVRLQRKRQRLPFRPHKLQRHATGEL